MPSQHTPFRADVHAIRAVAVVLVLVYHLDVGWLRGGFVGVDAFFVVSGYLITGQLLRQLRDTGRIDLPAFWARRARRLAPAALLVLAATATAAVLLTPREDWPTLGAQLAASALAVENWALAAASTDYLAAGDPSTPFEHFWSLGVEEQFYLLWPLLLLAVWWAARRRRRPIPAAGDRAVLVTVLVVIATSLTCSVVLTATDPAPAYFWPHTRAWEFGVGALLTLAPRVGAGAVGAFPGHPRVRAALAATGWLGLVACGLLLTPTVPYPGAAAVLPIAATALVIAGRTETGVLGLATRLPPVRWLGRVSYPLYLWHWPVALLLPRALDLPTPARVVVTVVLAAGLAHLTTVLVERPVTTGRLAHLRPRVTLAVVAAATALVLVVPAVGWGALTGQLRQDRALAAELSSDGDPCWGAAAIAPGSGCAVAGEPGRGTTPSTMTAAYDVDPTWDDCQAEATDARSCVVGVRGGTRVALIGDSHAHQWSSALITLAEQRGWELHLMVKGGCEFSHVRWSDVSAADERRCGTWNRAVDRSLAAAAPFALVFTSARADLRGAPVGTDPARSAHDGYRASWQPLIDRGAKIVAIPDTPAVGSGVQRCVDDHQRDPGACRISTGRAFAAGDRLVAAARTTPGAVVADMTPSFCAAGSCPAVIGNVLVYRDSQHLTRTYVTTLVGALGRRTDAALRAAG
ncbi:acyltransferase family protein [Curtobacterium herbarum]|uniref:Acyltransferase family protein n=1 Tax=Curtobacterium herbarum TaxID=150122 RepID=A0ABN1ZCZ3_9MICO|nr:acyltransferase family protein [Curtobacterium herbarum]MBM7475644.1 peptidoglycan/LPS O-acetylase OafA/YrhL [Curtobacterium herbarum]MCS6543557.1 acyltransferase [Curtobacterium herbarum]